jgi:DNA-binding response OmpR family regulator
MKTVLVVDDDPDVLESVKQVLEGQGYGVITASGGEECLKKLQESSPDLILLDIMMPGLPVKNVIEQIENIKIAYMSAVWISKARQDGLCEQDNIVDFIQKPFNVNDLVKRVEFLLTDSD